MNDVLSMILYRTIIHPYDINSFAFEPIIEFIISLVGSIAIGVATGLIVSYVTYEFHGIDAKKRVFVWNKDPEGRSYCHVSLPMGNLFDCGSTFVYI